MVVCMVQTSKLVSHATEIAISKATFGNGIGL